MATPRSVRPRLDAMERPPAILGIPAGAAPVLMCGPCSVESEEQIFAVARRLAPLGVQFLRGGAFKPRTSPYEFQGFGEPALAWLRRAADAHGMKVVTEAMSEATADAVCASSDLVQVGSRAMQNYPLLKAIGRSRKPVLLQARHVSHHRRVATLRGVLACTRCSVGRLL